MTLEDGAGLFGRTQNGSFAEKTLVAAGQCTKIDEESDAAAVGLLHWDHGGHRRGHRHPVRSSAANLSL